MARSLHDCRLVFVAPAEGQTAVGDYAQDFIDAVRPHFGEVVERRTTGPGTDRIRDIRGHRRAVAELVAGAPAGRVLVHAELSTGVLATFWSTAGLKGVPVSSTVHDPPQGPWLPARTEWLARSRLLTHGIHYPLRPVSRALEGAVYGDRTLFALTETGREAIIRTYPRARTHYVPHLVRERPAIRPVQERPRAVGLFGLVYRGKGFDQIAAIRKHLPSDITIRVAGRGTEQLPQLAGVEILGGVDGAREDAFFDSVQAIVVPYGKRHFYAETYPASGVVAHATAYRTPVVSTDYGSLAELGTQTGTVVVPTSRLAKANTVAADVAAATAALLDDPVRLAMLGANSDRTRQERSGPRVAEDFVAVWADLLALQSEGV